jgi:hypothetical protein
VLRRNTTSTAILMSSTATRNNFRILLYSPPKKRSATWMRQRLYTGPKSRYQLEYGISYYVGSETTSTQTPASLKLKIDL